MAVKPPLNIVLGGGMQRYKSIRNLAFSIVVFLITPSVIADEKGSGERGWLVPAQARDHIGEIHIICGTVRTTSRLQVRGRPTLLEFQKSRVARSFIVYVWVGVRDVLGMKAERLAGRDICVNGEIVRELNNPVVHVTIPEQLMEVQIDQ